MRPFKFFFMISMGLFVFFFLGRFFLFALLMAAILSTIFFISRKLFSFFYRLDWRENSPRFNSRRRQVPRWKDGLLLDYPTQKEKSSAYQAIEVH